MIITHSQENILIQWYSWNCGIGRYHFRKFKCILRCYKANSLINFWEFRVYWTIWNHTSGPTIVFHFHSLMGLTVAKHKLYHLSISQVDHWIMWTCLTINSCFNFGKINFSFFLIFRNSVGLVLWRFGFEAQI